MRTFLHVVLLSLTIFIGTLQESAGAQHESKLSFSWKSSANQTRETRRTQEETIGLYLGCGCFWHVQYELIAAEKEILGRNALTYTAVVGYAGGSGPGPGGRVCYKIERDDYSRQGHTEVVYLEIPQNRVFEFAQAYWKLFVGIDRKDIVDVGADYRAAIGIPGGVGSQVLMDFEAAQEGIMAQKMQLKAGFGSEPDTLGHPIVYVYNTSEFPFYMGEVYHQFHDDFGGPYGSPPYPQTYNDLQKALLERGVIAATGCRNDGDGIGHQKVIPAQSISFDTAAVATLVATSTDPGGQQPSSMYTSTTSGLSGNTMSDTPMSTSSTSKPLQHSSIVDNDPLTTSAAPHVAASHTMTASLPLVAFCICAVSLIIE